MSDENRDDMHRRIPKLNGAKDFATWRVYVEELLDYEDVLDVIHETPPEPESTSATFMPRWNKKNKKARSNIVFNLGTEPIAVVTSMLVGRASAYDIWKKMARKSWIFWKREALASTQFVNRSSYHVDKQECNELQCVPCIKAASKSAPLQSVINVASAPLELTHTDIAGHINPPSISGKLYIDVFLDDCTCISMVLSLRNKSEFFNTLRGYQALVEKEQAIFAYRSGLRMLGLRLDRAGEHTSLDVRTHALENGIVLQYSTAYASQSNGAAERLIQDLWKTARTGYGRPSTRGSLLLSANLPLSLWTEAISHSNWLRNRLPSNRIDMKVPYTEWYGDKLDFTTLLKFGTPGHSFIYRSDTATDQELLPRTMYGFFVGMGSSSTLYRVYIPSKKSIAICRHKEFTVSKPDKALPSLSTLLEDIARQRQLDEIEQNANAEEYIDESLHKCLFVAASNLSITSFKAKTRENRIPFRFEDACKIPEWAEAIDREFTALMNRGTWTFVDREPWMEVIPPRGTSASRNPQAKTFTCSTRHDVAFEVINNALF